MPDAPAVDATRTFGLHAETPPPHMLTEVRMPNIVRLDERTPDGRLIKSSGFGVRDLPLSFSAMFTTSHGMPGSAVLVGSIDQVDIVDGGVSAMGWLLDEPDARRAGRLIQAGALRGNSVELSAEQVDIEEDDQGGLLADFVKSKLMATTLVATPAMEGCTVELVDPEFDFGTDAEPVTASFTDLAAVVFTSTLAPVKDAPPASGYAAPDAGSAFPVRVDAPDHHGRMHVLGYLADWSLPHLAVPGAELYAPRSKSNYAYYAKGEALCDDGSFVATGVLTYGGGHADKTLDWAAATAHYDNVCNGWADVAIGEDEFGIWVAGYVRPGVDANTVVMARASGLSGDWRRVGGRLELVAALSVNAGAFPIARPAAFSDNGRQTCLIGAGQVQAAPAAATFSDTDQVIRRMAARLDRDEAREIREALLEDQQARVAALLSGEQ